MKSKEMIAMILAGGQGTRLGKLTQSTAKPALPFGGAYRIIDFALSNCTNSGIETVGVVTQYEPLELNTHIGNGSSWGFNVREGGATILQPYAALDGKKWFQGTAHAIYQNIDYIDTHKPEFVLVLSGDHIYKMDYKALLEYHKIKQASLTVGVIRVPMEEASRFGIMNTDETERIIEFEEKPKKPKNNYASMGIYIFNWPTLKRYLQTSFTTDEELEDFGADVIPMYLNNGEQVFAYEFEGYWKDVGTIESLWEANMEFINPKHALNIKDESWRIYSKNDTLPPHFILEEATINDAMIVDGCYVMGDVEHSILAQNVRVGLGTHIKDSMIMSNVVIGKNALIDKAIIGENAVIGDGAVVHQAGGIAVVGYGETIGGLSDEKE